MNRQIRIGAILQYLQLFISVLISLAYTPIMLSKLGQTEYGLYNVASSVVSYLSLLSLGIGASYIRFYTIKKKENNGDVASLNGLYLSVFTIIGSVALVGGLVLAPFSNIFFNETYSTHELEIAKILMIILTINLAISFPMSVFSSYISAQEKFIFQKSLNIIRTIISPSLSIVFLFMGFGSIGMAIATIVISLVVDIINIFYCFKNLKMKVSFKKIEKGLFKSIFAFSFFIAINSLVEQINWQTDKIILGKMATGAIVSIYAIGATLNTYYIQLSSAISTLFSPKINKIVVSDDKDKDLQLTKIMTKVGRIQFFILSFVLIGFIFFGKYFVLKWAGQDYLESYYVALLLMCPATIGLIQSLGIEIQRAKNKHKFRSWAYLVMSLINVGISIFLCYFWGAIGTALGTTISLVITNGIIMNIYYHKKLNLNMKYFWINIIKILPSLILPIATGLLLYFNNIDSVQAFLKSIFVFTCIFAFSVYNFAFSKDEKHIFKSLLSKK